MLQANRAMYFFLRDIDMDRIVPSTDYPITEHRNGRGEPFWIQGSLPSPIEVYESFSGTRLTDVEWDDNEVWIGTSESFKEMPEEVCKSIATPEFSGHLASGSFKEMLEEALGVLKQWKNQMEAEFSSESFDIILSIDFGEYGAFPSATIRFYAIRENDHIIGIDEMSLEKIAQPVLNESVSP